MDLATPALPAATPAAAPAPPASPAAPPAATSPAAPSQPTGRYTQEDVDRMIQERLQRAEPKYAELRDKARQYDALQAANQSEIEKAQQRADAAETAKREATDAAATATKAAHEMLRKAAIISAAATAGAVSPEAAYALLVQKDFKAVKDGTELPVTVGDDGQVIGAQEAVTALLATETYLVGSLTPPSDPTPGPGGGGARTTPPPPDLKTQIRDAEVKGDWATARRLKSKHFVQLQS